MIALPVSGSRRWRTSLAYLCALCAEIAACSSERLYPIDMLPADNEVGNWVHTGGISLATDQTGLFNRIAGAAPKYIDRGWVSAAYADYDDGTRIISVAIHDMGNAANAQDIYGFSLPAARQPIPGRDNAVVDMGLPTAYAAYAYFDRFYIELLIDEKSDAALTSIEAFMSDILDRSSRT